MCFPNWQALSLLPSATKNNVPTNGPHSHRPAAPVPRLGGLSEERMPFLKSSQWALWGQDLEWIWKSPLFRTRSFSRPSTQRTAKKLFPATHTLMAQTGDFLKPHCHNNYIYIYVYGILPHVSPSVKLQYTYSIGTEWLQYVMAFSEIGSKPKQCDITKNSFAICLTICPVKYECVIQLEWKKCCPLH